MTNAYKHFLSVAVEAMALYAPTPSVVLFSDARQLVVSADVIQSTAMAMVLPFVYATGAMGAVAMFCNRFVFRPPRFVLLSLCFAVFAAFSIGMCAVGIQVDAFNEMRAATATFAKTATSVNATVAALEADVTACTSLAWVAILEAAYAPNFNAEIRTLEEDFTEYYGDAVSYSDTILTNVMMAQLSMAPLYMVMFLVAVTVLCFSMLFHHNERTTSVPIWVVLIVIVVLGVVCGALLTVLRLHANLCMQPADSIINVFSVTNTELEYYLQCTLDPTIPSPFAGVFASITKVADEIGRVVRANDGACKPHEIGMLGRQVMADAMCATMTVGPRTLVAAVCRESFNAMMLLFTVTATQLLVLSWLACTMRV